MVWPMQSLLQGGSVSAGGTPLGTPPGNGFHSTAGLPRTGSAQGMQHAPQQQQQQGAPVSSSFSFLGQVRGLSGCLLLAVKYAVHSALWRNYCMPFAAL